MLLIFIKMQELIKIGVNQQSFLKEVIVWISFEGLVGSQQVEV